MAQVGPPKAAGHARRGLALACPPPLAALLLATLCLRVHCAEGYCGAGESDGECLQGDEAHARPLLGTDPSAHGPLDCHGSGCEVTGRGCHAECECRHLDNVERSRFQEGSAFRYPRRPSLVITASRDGSHTASTWAFNAARLLFRQAREACDSYWVRRLTREKLERRLVTGAHVVVKTHEWTGQMSRPEFVALVPMFSHVVVSVREGFNRDPAWMEFATHAIHYEGIVARDSNGAPTGALEVLRNLARHLGIVGLTDVDLRVVDYELMTLSIPTTGCNQTSKLWGFHKRRGGRTPPERPPEAS